MKTKPGRQPAKRKSRRRAAQTPSQGERRIEGLGVASGIAIGPAHVVESGMSQVPEYKLSSRAVEGELVRFAGAVALSHGQLKKLKAKAATMSVAAAEELGYLLEAHVQMLSGSRLIRGVERRIKEDRINAEAAVQAEISEITLGFAAVGDPYLAARVDDIREAGGRLIRNLTKTPHRAFSDLPKDTVIVAEEITPADTALMDPQRVAGFATLLGGPESHTAIMARSLGLPAVLGATGLLTGVHAGETVIVDGDAGLVVVDPEPGTVDHYRRRRVALRREQRLLARLRPLPSVTRDNVEITLQANVELPLELAPARQAGAQGIGLLRSEFLYMNRDDLPDEDEQYEGLRALVVGMAGRPVTVRTLDLGSDKLASTLEGVVDAVNPALGLRAIRLSLKVSDLLETQLAAMLRAGAHGNLRILLPMISSASEVRQVRATMKRVAARLRRRGVKIADPLPPLGVMIEVPGAALAADGLARTADFFSIGTNDLTMYTLAIDRGDEQVAHLYDPLHPAVLRLIQFATEAALRSRIPVNICGEIAGDPRYTALLLGLGLRDLSMAATQLPRVEQRIRSLDLLEATRRARTVMDQTDSGRIAALIDDFNALS
jgi:phosphotransferase system enzyme I (PtsI)